MLDPCCFISHFSWETAFLLFPFPQLSKVLGHTLTAKQDFFCEKTEFIDVFCSPFHSVKGLQNLQDKGVGTYNF